MASRKTSKSRREPALPPLHELEAEIMEEVWRQGETTVKLVMEALNRKAKRAGDPIAQARQLLFVR